MCSQHTACLADPHLLDPDVTDSLGMAVNTLEHLVTTSKSPIPPSGEIQDVLCVYAAAAGVLEWFFACKKN